MPHNPGQHNRYPSDIKPGLKPYHIVPLTGRAQKKHHGSSRPADNNQSRIEQDLQNYSQLLLEKKKAESNQTNQIKRKIELILNRGGMQNPQSSRSPDKMGIYGMGIYNS